MVFTWVDISIATIVALSVLTGLFRGFVKELVALFVWILAIWLGLHYAQRLDPWLLPYLEDQTLRRAVGFVLILLACLLVGGIINTLLSFILKRSGLSGTDRTLGMGFGFIRGVFIVALMILAVEMTSLPYQEYAKDSVLYARFNPLVVWLSGKMPAFVAQVKKKDTRESKEEDLVPIQQS